MQDIPLPRITEITAEGQIKQLQDYIFQLVEILNFNFSQIKEGE